MRSIDLFEIISGGDPVREKSASLYQDILLYSLEIKEELDFCFRFTELGNYLVRANIKIRQYYDGTSSKKNTTFSNRLHGQKRKILNCLQELIRLNLIVSYETVKSAKNDLLTMSYKFTKKGILLALLLGTQSQDPKLASRCIDILFPYVTEPIRTVIGETMPLIYNNFRKVLLEFLEKKSAATFIIAIHLKDKESFESLIDGVEAQIRKLDSLKWQEK
jgi:hypothetical protein